MSGDRPPVLVGWLIAGAISLAFALAASAWTGSGTQGGSGAPGLAPSPFESAAERITDWLAAYVAIAIALVQLLGFAGWFRVWTVLLAAAACGAIGIARGGWFAFRARARDLFACIRGAMHSLPLIAAVAFGLALWLRAVALREVSWDGLVYHLTYPAVWIQRGAFVAFGAPGIWEQFESFPKGAEALYALAMLPLRADDLTYFVHPPLWLGTGCAMFAVVRRVGGSRSVAELAAACALVSPGLGAFLSPANLEIPVAFAFLAAVSAAARVLVAREPAALGPCLLALCLGASIKVTSLAYLPLGVLVVLACARFVPLAECLRSLLRDALLGAAIALPWYLNNLVRCGNPIYPAPLPLATGGPAAGTLANAWIVRESSVLAQRVVSDVFQTLAQPPWAARYPGPGWLYLFVMLASTLLVLIHLARNRARTAPRLPPAAAAILTAVAWLLSLLYLLMPWNGVFWAANTRFLTPALLVGLLAVAAATAVVRRWLGASIWTVAVAISIASWCSPRFWQAIRWTTAPTAVASVFAHSQEQILATAARGVSLREPTQTQLWRHVETLPPSRIAYAVGGIDAQEGWVFYPLFGSSLQHDVRYVDVERVASPTCQRRGMIRDDLDEAAWLERLSAEHIAWLVITARPQERNWVEARPNWFSLAFSAGEHRLYAVHPP